MKKKTKKKNKKELKEHKLTDWLPTTKKEVEAREWDYIDVILFSGDAYVDHPSFGAAVIGRTLEAMGLRVAIVPQPDWRGDYRDFLRALGDTYGNRIIVLGRGAEGAAMYLREENRIFALPAVQVGEIVNTVGAGDALFSGFLHHFARGYRPLDALARAQVFASAKIRVSGAANGFPAEKEMESLCREYAGRMEYYEV